MSETKFTQGEWHVSKKGIKHKTHFVFVKESDDSQNICEIASVIDNEADAHLISAAKKLFEALNDMPDVPHPLNKGWEDLTQEERKDWFEQAQFFFDNWEVWWKDKRDAALAQAHPLEAL